MVRNHGIYTWGDNWERAKVIAECYDYLFKMTVESLKIGISIPRDEMAPIDMEFKAWYLPEELNKKAVVSDGKVVEEIKYDIRDSLQDKECRWVDRSDLS